MPTPWTSAKTKPAPATTLTNSSPEDLRPTLAEAARLPWLLRFYRILDRLLGRHRWRILDARTGRIAATFADGDLYEYLTQSIAADELLMDEREAFAAIDSTTPIAAVDDFIADLLGPCTDPDCPIHNEAARARRCSATLNTRN